MPCAAYTAVAGKYRQRTDVQCFGDVSVFQQPVMEAKRYKILPHLFVAGDVTLWIDGNITLRAEPQAVADALLDTGADMAIFRHSYRSTVWQEFATLKDDPRFAIPYLQQQLAAQAKAYRDDGLPDDAQLYECNVIVRRNNDRVNRLMEAWWAQICRWQWRDQVSLPYVLWKYGDGLALSSVTGNVRNHPLFDYVSQY